MAGIEFTTFDLAACLGEVPPAELLGMTLLEQRPPDRGRWFPSGIDRQQIIQATVQVIDYNERCNELADKLNAVHATVGTQQVAEFGL